ncbi:MAG: D-2-hydroxyacid dehydrogenase [Bryobacteraceae bacterium]|nr:D-2-hydroxyacid dehydrogenase [Bryobacteraceae bacterium]
MNLLVIANPTSPHLRVLDQLPADVTRSITTDPDELRRLAPETDVVLNTLARGSELEPIFPLLTRTKWIHSLSAGVEKQLFPAMVESDIPLTNARGVYKESLGEFVVAAALYFAKDLRRMIRQQGEARWEQFDVDMLNRQTMGVVGYGEVGKAAARRGKALGMKVIATKRRDTGADGIAERIYLQDQRGDMIAESDVIVAAAPHTPDTIGLIGEAEFARMKPTAVVINVGRGPVIDEAAMVRALRERRIRGAALDVFDVEPLPQGHPFWTLDNVLLSPHCADHTSTWLEEAVEFFVSNYRRFAAGEPLENVVDKKAGY